MKNIARGLFILFIIFLITGSVGDLNKALASDEAQINNSLQVPNPRFPKNGYSITSGTTLLVWSVSIDSTQYEIELFRPAGSRLDKWDIEDPTCTTTTCSYKLPYKLGTEFGEYNWRVRGKTSASYSAWSSYAMFAYVPLNDLETITPIIGENIYDSTPFFAWHDAAEGVYRYLLEIYQEDGTLVFRNS